MTKTVRVAGVQAAPVFLDAGATVAKAVALIEEAAANGAELVAFAESWLPGYPSWIFGAAGWEDAGAKAVYRRFRENAIAVPSPATDELCRAARANGVVVVMGMTERDSDTVGGSLYNSLLYISARARSSASIASSCPRTPSGSSGDRATARCSSSRPASAGSAG